MADGVDASDDRRSRRGAGRRGRGRDQTRAPRTRSASIRIHGRGPLSDLLASALRCSGARIKHSSQPHAAVTADTTDLVVLSDSLVADPRMLRDLHAARHPAPAGAGARRRRPGRAAGGARRDQLPAMRGPAPQRPGRRLARRRRSTARHRRQRRPGHRAGHRGAGAQPGRPRDRGRARRRRTRSRHRNPRRRSTPRWSSTSTPARPWHAGGARHPRCMQCSAIRHG